MPELPHIFVSGTAEVNPYTSSASGGRRPVLQARNRAGHGEAVQIKLEAARQATLERSESRTAFSLPTRQGTYLEFESAPGSDLITKSLENRGKNIRLLNVRTVNTGDNEDSPQIVTKATVFIPSGEEGYFVERVRQFVEEETSRGKPKNFNLLTSIENVQLALLESLWTDDVALIPNDDPVWCEVWLRGDTPEVVSDFRSLAARLNYPTQEGCLVFPERTVILVQVNQEGLTQLLESSDSLAEFRKAKETANFWIELENLDQSEWVENLEGRLSVSPDPSVAINILDTGVNNGHDLLAPVLQDTDKHAYSPDWGTDDHKGHGTLMSGLAAYGNLQQCLETDHAVTISHCLESVKILPPRGHNVPTLYGTITSQATSFVEIQAPDRTHIHCMAVTADDGRDKGKPSSWSAAIDALAAGLSIDQLVRGRDDSEIILGERRLYIVSAGNLEGQEEWQNYPDSNKNSSLLDPAQSWNALTVGAYTEKDYISDTNLTEYTTVAPSGSLSPYSTTSCMWENKWPNKPDIVMEGGNLIKAPDGFCSECEDTSLLSLSHLPRENQFDWINATSAATAQASWMAAQIQDTYPEAWPETVRALMVHSAIWPERMKSEFLDSQNRTDYARLLRVCGYGVPALDRALNCASNRLTLIAQSSLQPYDRAERGSRYRTKDMNIHELPWPKDVLESLGDTQITMRITLSYFIEPGPGEVGWKDKYRYASFALRFDLNSPLETKDQFRIRLSAAARDEDEVVETDSGSARWTIGSNGRSRGSISSDIWTGSAAELAACNLVGIYPVIGWWRERAWLGRWNQQARYSLVVSLHSPEQNIDQPIDIYTPVANQVGITTEVPIET